MGRIKIATLGAREHKTIKATRSSKEGVGELEAKVVIETLPQPILTDEEAAQLTKEFDVDWLPSPYPQWGKYMTCVEGRRFFAKVIPEEVEQPVQPKKKRGRPSG